MKIYVVIMGENLESAKKAHGDNFFTSVEDAANWARMMLEPAKRFWICDENGGVLLIGTTPKVMSRA